MNILKIVGMLRDCIFYYAFFNVHITEDKISLTLSSRSFQLCSAIRLIDVHVRLDCNYIPENKSFFKVKINHISSAISSSWVT